MLPGQTISHYRILERLGEGGMGEVFLAEDTSLDRRVALKVLSPALAADPARRERFVREAKAVAALSHPNIVTVYSVEQAGEAHFLTMELVDGKTLADLIPPAGLPIDRLLDLAIPLADAIAAAHERGITHRDLKPANVMVTGGGRVKVLDFGLAKLSAPGSALGSAETMAGGASALTGEGKIVGTVAYMSPEQAEGRNVDHRTDIFAFGVLLYEMATGVRPFTGDTSLSVLSAIMKDTPKPASELNPRVPRELGKIIRRCLQKDPEQRFQNAKDIRNELQELQRDLASGELDAPMASAPAAAVVPRRRAAGSGLILAIAGVAVLAAGAGLWLWSGGRGPTAPADVRFTQLTFQAGTEGWPSLSPDGRWVVYAAAPTGNFDVLLQSVGGQTTINLTKDSPSSDSQPAFSPDGEEIAFRSARQGGGIFVMRRTGEFVRRVTDNGFNPTWSPDGTQLAYVTESTVNRYGRVAVSELWTVTVATGEKRRLPAEDAMEPHWSPDGRHIAYWGLPPGTSRRDIFTIPVDGGAPIAVTDDEPLDASPAWTPDGSAIYFASDRGGSGSSTRATTPGARATP